MGYFRDSPDSRRSRRDLYIYNDDHVFSGAAEELRKEAAERNVAG